MSGINEKLKFETEIQNQKIQSQTQEENKKSHIVNRCKYCGSVLSLGMPFCENCGEKVTGEGHTCPICETVTTKNICPHCGYKIVPSICPNCGCECHYDICEKCGTAMNQQILSIISKKSKNVELKEMGEERAKEIESQIQKAQSEEVKTFFRKIEEHRILLEEKDYSKNREKRIVSVFGKNSLFFEFPDEDERRFMMKAYKDLESALIEKKEKALKEKLDRLAPEIDEKEEERQKQEIEQKLNEENEKIRKELEKKYKEVLKQVSSDIEIAHINEKKRLEEERIRKEFEEKKKREEDENLKNLQKKREEIELKRQRIEQEEKENDILGIYVSGGGKDSTTTMGFTKKNGCNVSGYLKAETTKISSHYTGYGEFNGTISNGVVHVELYSFHGDYNNCTVFDGKLNGEILNGIWIGNGGYYDYFKVSLLD